MSKNPIEQNQTLVSLADQSIENTKAQGRNGMADTAVIIGLILSALFTIIYMVVALGGAMMAMGWAAIISYGMGVLLGVAAIMPGEGAIWIWKTKLQTDIKINNRQQTVAWIAGLLAAVSASVSTVSFFSYLLQSIMPQWYNGDTASGVNIVNIAASWAVFGIGIFVYYGFSSETKSNIERAAALNLVDDGINSMIKGLAMGITSSVDDLIEDMRDSGSFAAPALKIVSRHMGEEFSPPKPTGKAAGATAVAHQSQPPAPTSQPQPEARPSSPTRPFGLEDSTPRPLSGSQPGDWNNPAGEWYRPG